MKKRLLARWFLLALLCCSCSRDDRKEDFIALSQTLRDEIASAELNAGIVVKDLSAGWEFSHNNDRLFKAASLVKIPIMLAVLDAAQDRKINLSDSLALKPSDKTQGSGVLKNMPAGLSVSVEQLIEYMITKSDNTATNMLIDLLGFDYISSYFKTLGLKNTTLARKMMDFRYRNKGVENYTTAQDMAYILERLYRKQFLNSAVSERCFALLKQQEINDRIPAQLPAGIVVAHKTGLENKVCHDVGIIFTPKGDVLICVLTENAKTSRIAKKFIATIAKDAYNYLQ